MILRFVRLTGSLNLTLTTLYSVPLIYLSLSLTPHSALIYLSLEPRMADADAQPIIASFRALTSTHARQAAYETIALNHIYVYICLRYTKH